MKNLLHRLRNDEEGATMLEYTILLAIITAAVIGIISTVGTEVSAVWTAFQGTFSSVPGA